MLGLKWWLTLLLVAVEIVVEVKVEVVVKVVVVGSHVVYLEGTAADPGRTSTFLRLSNL